MSKVRFIFEKHGKARYISHLDLMRTFQRALVRSGLKMKLTEGFNPHIYVTIALPLPLGFESYCEILDAELLDVLPLASLPEIINPFLPVGIKIVSADVPFKKASEIKFLKCRLCYFYDYNSHNSGFNRSDDLLAFFSQPNIPLLKRTKSGETLLNLREHISSLSVVSADTSTLTFTALLSAQNPTINPSHLTEALRQASSPLCPNFASYARIAAFDSENATFK